MASIRQIYQRLDEKAKRSGLLGLVVVMVIIGLAMSVFLLPPGPDDFINQAAARGDVERVKKWLDRDQSLINALDYYNGGTSRPIHHAARNGHKPVVELLLSRGADVNMKGVRPRYTALEWALEEDLREKRDGPSGLLAKSDGDLSVHDRFAGRREVIALLLSKGAEIDSSHQVDKRLMSWATDNGYDDIVNLLVGRGLKREQLQPHGDKE